MLVAVRGLTVRISVINFADALIAKCLFSSLKSLSLLQFFPLVTSYVPITFPNITCVFFPKKDHDAINF